MTWHLGGLQALRPAYEPGQGQRPIQLQRSIRVSLPKKSEPTSNPPNRTCGVEGRYSEADMFAGPLRERVSPSDFDSSVDNLAGNPCFLNGPKTLYLITPFST